MEDPGWVFGTVKGAPSAAASSNTSASQASKTPLDGIVLPAVEKVFRFSYLFLWLLTLFFRHVKE